MLHKLKSMKHSIFKLEKKKVEKGGVRKEILEAETKYWELS